MPSLQHKKALMGSCRPPLRLRSRGEFLCFFVFFLFFQAADGRWARAEECGRWQEATTSLLKKTNRRKKRRKRRKRGAGAGFSDLGEKEKRGRSREGGGGGEAGNPFHHFFSDSRYDFNPLCASRYELFFSVSHCSWFMMLEDYMHFSVLERFK